MNLKKTVFLNLLNFTTSFINSQFAYLTILFKLHQQNLQLVTNSEQ